MRLAKPVVAGAEVPAALRALAAVVRAVQPVQDQRNQAARRAQEILVVAALRDLAG